MSDQATGFIDAEEEYSARVKGLTFQQLVLKHLSKISDICTGEFRPGYWQKKPIHIGMGVEIAETYVEDKRDCYINAVDFLHDLLLPYFDEEMKTQAKKIDEEVEKERKKTKEDKDSNKFIFKKLRIKRKLLQQISLLLQRLGYLEIKKLSQ